MILLFMAHVAAYLHGMQLTIFLEKHENAETCWCNIGVW